MQEKAYLIIQTPDSNALRTRSMLALVTAGVLVAIGAFQFARGGRASARSFFLWGLVSILYTIGVMVFQRSRKSVK
jgi:hypothetical protein